MELKAEMVENKQCMPSVTDRVKKGKAKAIVVRNELKQAGKDDPRKYIHGIKVGIAITLVSMLYYFEPLYNGFGYNTVWAVMTVVVVFEFTVGGVLYKGINRGSATLFAGALGIGFQQLTRLCGDTGRPIALSLVLFTFAAGVTFLRFSPYLRARFEYGFTIFTLTFTMVGLTGYRAGELWTYARIRLLTILIGAALVMLVSILIFPAWAGDDLNKLIHKNLEKLANYLEGFPSEYFQASQDEKERVVKDSQEDKSFLKEYKSVLNSKASEENLLNFARWEPFHGRFRPCHPWNLYLEVGAQTRQVACQIDALNCHLSEGNINVPSEFKAQIEEPCKKICSELSKALKSLSSSIKELTSNPDSVNLHTKNAKATVEELKMTLKDISAKSDLPMDLLAIMPAASVASILIETVRKMDKVVESVEELAGKARFKTNDDKENEKSEPSMALRRSSVVAPLCTDEDFVVVNISKVEPDDQNSGRIKKAAVVVE